MSSIDKPAGEKYWKIQFYYGGRKYRRSLKVEKYAHARKIQQRIDYEIAAGTLNVNDIFQNKGDDATLDAFLSDYLRYLESRRSYAAGTVYAYRNSIRILKELIPGRTQLSDITPRRVETRLIPELERVYKPATVKHHLGNLRTIFSFAVKWEALSKNPFSSLVPKAPKRLPVFFKREEIAAIKSYFYAHRKAWQRVYFLTLLLTGNRRTEHLALRWSVNVFLDEGFIKFVGKGNKERLVPLSDEATALFRGAERRLGEDRVFWQCASIYTVNSAWNQARKDLGLTYKLHNFRSNYASHFMMAGGSLYDLMNILGWENYETAKIYLNFSDDHVAKNKNRVTF